jgi:hypothetical protein
VAAIKAGAYVISAGDVVETGRQFCVSMESGCAFSRPNILSRQIPTRPVWLTVIVVVINRLDRALNQVMIVIASVGHGVAWIGVAALLGSLRPSIPVRMKCDTMDAQANAAAFEFFGAMLFHPQGNLRQQKPLRWKRPEDGFHRRTEMNERRASGFAAGIRKDVIRPVNIFNRQMGHVGL